VEDFPLWLKLIIWLTLGSTAIYVLIGIFFGGFGT
jgi:hypothetical protein